MYEFDVCDDITSEEDYIYEYDDCDGDGEGGAEYA